MAKLKKTMFSILIALALFLAAGFGLSAFTWVHASASETPDDDPKKVWIITNDTLSNISLAMALDHSLYASGYEVDYIVAYDSQEQIEYISRYKSDADVFYIFPIDSNSLIEVLNEVHDEYPDIRIFIMGPFNQKYPEGTVFFSKDYYSLGYSYVEWIIRDRDGENHPENVDILKVCILYEDSAEGQQFKDGFIKGILDMSVTSWLVDERSYSNLEQVHFIAEECIQTDMDEVVTCYDFIAKEIFDLYLQAGYRYSTTHDGTGIRAFSLSSEEYDDELTTLTTDTVEDFCNGEYDGKTPNAGDFWVVYLPFVPAYSLYVSK